MLGKMPFVSMSERRLGGIENSSLRYLSAIRALEFSTSRMVRPSFSRRVRRLFPAGSIARLQNWEESYHCRAVNTLRIYMKNFISSFACYEFRTHATPRWTRAGEVVQPAPSPRAFSFLGCEFSVDVRNS